MNRLGIFIACLLSFVALHAASGALKEMLSYAFSAYGVRPVLFSGGVMSCVGIRQEMSALCEGYFAQPQYSSDNAAGIALLARASYLKGEN